MGDQFIQICRLASVGTPHSHLVQVQQKVRGILVNAVRARPFQFILAITARKEPDSQCMRAA